jgi:hypothetical protein
MGRWVCAVCKLSHLYVNANGLEGMLPGSRKFARQFQGNVLIKGQSPEMENFLRV